LAKNLYLNLDTSIRRKIDEIILAFKLEEQYSKDEILTMYLNVVPFGKGTHGIEEASLYYLGKHAKDLSVYEAALLIGSLKAPETQNFIDDPDTAHSRARAILSAMEEVGTIEDADKLDRAVRKGGLENSTMNEAMLYGALRGEAEKLLDGQTGDFTIVSTVDPGLQRHSEDELEEGVQRIRRGNRSSQGPTGAVVVMGPGGEILASVGTHDWKEYQYDNSRMAHRQPGSAIKPFVFAAAFKQNADLRPQTLVPASKMTFDGGFRPQNADGLYPEQIPLEDALAHSRNTTAVWLLDTKVGLNDFYDFSRRFGLYDSPNEKPFDNLSVALGSREVTPLELTNAYTAFAQQGVQYEPHMVRFVRDGRGNIEQAKYDPVRVLSESVAIQVNGMLRRVVTHGTGKENVYDPDIPLAGKTGTTNENRDAWFAGYQFGVKNPVTAAVWIGRPNGNGSSGTTGHGMPAHIFHEIMEGVGHDYSAPQREAVSISEVIPAPEKPPESESNPTDSSTESKNETPSKVADWIRSIREKLASTKMPDVFASESTEEVDKFNRQEAELVQKAEQSGNDMDYYRLADFYFDHGKNRKAKKALANIEHLTSIASQITSLSPEMARYLVRKIEYGFPLTRLMDFSSETAGELAKHKDILRIGGVRNAEARSILENNFQGTQLFIGGVQAN
jgi:penicillin-binding protein 1A